MIRLDPSSTSAPFEQVRAQVAALIVEGELEPGSKLPPIRQLAGDLSVAPNTIARAYRELEADGLIRSQGRRGTVVLGGVADDPVTVQARAAAAGYAATLKRLALDRTAAVRLLNDAWEA